MRNIFSLANVFSKLAYSDTETSDILTEVRSHKLKRSYILYLTRYSPKKLFNSNNDKFTNLTVNILNSSLSRFAHITVMNSFIPSSFDIKRFEDLINRIPNQDKSLSMFTYYFSNIVSRYIERSDVSIDIIISNSTIIQNILRNMSFNDLTLFHQSIVYQNPSRINSKNRSSYIENLVYEKYLNGNGSEEINKSILYYAVNVIQSRLPINVEEKLKIDPSDWKEYVNMMKTVRVKIKS